MQPTPVIDITDLYHPHEDVGDNFDLIMAYGLPEIDLRAVVLDITDAFRGTKPDPLTGNPNRGGPREPGFLPVTQLNAIFDRSVPCGVTPFMRLRSPDDTLLDTPRFQQSGIDLLLQTLSESSTPVHVLGFGSCRALALAFNRAPDLMREKIAQIHLSAGCSTPGFREHNIGLDSHASHCLLRSGLPITLYPCAEEHCIHAGAMHGFNEQWQTLPCYGLGRNNTCYLLPDLSWMESMHPLLRGYLGYAFDKHLRHDFIQGLADIPAPTKSREGKVWHPVWETAIWMNVAGRKLVRHTDGTCDFLRPEQILATDRVYEEGTIPCTIEILPDKGYAWQPTDGEANFSIYYREDPAGYAQTAPQALARLYQSFQPTSTNTNPELY